MLTVQDLLDRVQRLDPTERLTIRTQNNGIGAHRTVDVEAGSRGFDWTNGQFILIPAEPLVVVHRETRPLPHVAREHLERLKAAHKSTFPEGKYIPKTREQDWIDGYCAGARMWITEATP